MQPHLLCVHDHPQKIWAKSWSCMCTLVPNCPITDMIDIDPPMLVSPQLLVSQVLSKTKNHKYDRCVAKTTNVGTCILEGCSSFRRQRYDHNAQNAIISVLFTSNLWKPFRMFVIDTLYMIVPTLHDSYEFKLTFLCNLPLFMH